MNYKELKRKWEAGEFTLDCRGHNMTRHGLSKEMAEDKFKYAMENFIRSAEFYLAYNREAKAQERAKAEGRELTEKDLEVRRRMSKIDQERAASDNFVVPGKPFRGFGLSDCEYNCSCCSRSLRVGLFDEHTLALYEWRQHPDYIGSPRKMFRTKKGERHHIMMFKRTSERLSRPCKYHRGLEPLHHTITVPTGQFIIANHFGGDWSAVPKELEHTEEWSLNNLIGRENREKYVAKRNIAYGQLGNTYFDIWANKDRTHIKLVGSSKLEILEDEVHWMEKEGEDEPGELEKFTKLRDELRAELDGFKNIGGICCDVWAWYGSDVSMLPEEYNHEKTDNKEIFDLVPGDWDVVTYYHYYPSSKTNLYAEMRLI